MKRKELVFILLLTFILFFIYKRNFAIFSPFMNDFIDLAGSCNPDFPCFSYSEHNGNHHGTFGNYIPLQGTNSENIATITTVVPFIELYNFETGYPYSWQLWRASLGLEHFWKFKKKLGENIVLSIGYIHESDHYTDPDFLRKYILSGFPEISNENFSSYEYINSKLIYSNAKTDSILAITLLLSLKYYVRDPVIKKKYAYNGEFINKIRLGKKFSLFLSGYYEYIKNEFNSELFGFIKSSVNEPFIYQIINTGLEFKNEGGVSLQIYRLFSNSNGRGVDLTEKTKTEGFGIRFISVH